MEGFPGPGMGPGMLPALGMMPPGLMGGMGELPFAGGGPAMPQHPGAFPGQPGLDGLPGGQQALPDGMDRGGHFGPPPPPGKRRSRGNGGGGGRGPGAGGVGGGHPQMQGGGGDRAGVRSTPFKSRLCTQFMRRGACDYGSSCHFAHGYEDLQTPDQQPMAGGPMDAAQMEAMQRAGMMMPGMLPGMVPPEMMAMAMGGMVGGPPHGMLHRPRPPPGPPPGAPPPDGLLMPGMQPEQDQWGFAFNASRTPTRLPSDVPYMSRVRAACLLMRVGAVRPRDVGQDAVEATVAGMQTGEAFQANAYADALSLYAH